MATPMFDDPIPNLDNLPIPFDADLLSDDIPFSDNFYDDVLNFDSDFNLDDLDLPSDDFLNSIDPSSNYNHPQSNSISPHSFHVSDDIIHPDLYQKSPEGTFVVDVAGEQSSSDRKYLNVSSSDSRDSGQESRNFGFGGSRVSNSVHSCSQGSDDCVRSVDQRINSEESKKNHLLKRKKEDEDGDYVLKSNKSQRSNGFKDKLNVGDDDEEEKRKARLIRNRESAHLSRQKKKQYVEELEEKVRAMHSTIQDLNAKISYIVAENTTLRQQMGAPPVPGMYPHPAMAPMGYQWAPPYQPYYVNPHGSKVPLVPIPRLKPQVQNDKSNKNGESKKKEGKSKTKKVASVSFLGLLFFILLFGGLVPMVNVKQGGLSGKLSGQLDYDDNRFGHQNHGSKVVVVNGTDHESGTRFSSHLNCYQGHGGAVRGDMKQFDPEEFALSGNNSDHLVASLYVPRNDKLVKIDGNLIIHSVLAGEKAIISHESRQPEDGKNSLAVPSSLTPAISFPREGQKIESLPHLYQNKASHKALPSSKDDQHSRHGDGELQQWFLEGLGGPVLRSGMCTEVFQFDVSPIPGAIIPSTSVRNTSAEENRNSTRINKGNRRILQGLPIPLAGASSNTGGTSKKENTTRNSSHSPMVVSVLIDPREVGDFNDDGILGTKPLSRIFVVVLLDSVKYVTYSCMLPFKGFNQLVTA